MAAEDTLAQIAQDAETRLAAKRRERAERGTLKMAEIKRRQTIEEDDQKINGATSPTGIRANEWVYVCSRGKVKAGSSQGCQNSIRHNIYQQAYELRHEAK